MKAFGKVMPAYSFGNSPFYLTGEILLEPKEGIAIEKILNLIDKKASIIRHSKYNYYVLESKDWKNILSHSNEIYESGLVKYCHPNFIAPVKRSADDPLYSDQYYLYNTGQFGGTSGIDINAPGAWNIITGSCSVRIAIIDDGIENHEDFDGRVLSGYTAKYSSDNPDTEGAPNAEDPPSTAISGDEDGPFGHGVSCAGIVAAGHNSKGIRGVAPNVEIVPVNIFNDWQMVSTGYSPPYDSAVQFTEDAEDFGNAIDYAWDEGDADVLSNSWGYDTDDPDLIASSDHIISAIGRARNQGGAVVVFSSGNGGNVPVRFPANVDGVSVNWSHSSNFNYVSGQGTDSYQLEVTGHSVAGPDWVKASISVGDFTASIQKDVYLNPPSSDLSIEVPYEPLGGDADFVAWGAGVACGITNYNWSVEGGFIKEDNNDEIIITPT
jgi:hypothetical protein